MSAISVESENVSRYRPQSNQQHGQMSVHCDKMNPQLISRTRSPILERLRTKRFRGASQQSGNIGGRYSVERRIPNVGRLAPWGSGKNLATLPNVQGIISGVEKTTFLAQSTARIKELSSGRNFPKITKSYPTDRFVWARDKNIARIPAAILSGNYPSGHKSVSPQGVRDISRKVTSARISVQI